MVCKVVFKTNLRIMHLILNNKNISLSDSLSELIQNADDNSYPDSLGEGECPSVQFIMQPEGVVVLNNETGFADKNIRALCDVGRSTKGKHKAGYIGTQVYTLKDLDKKLFQEFDVIFNLAA